MNDRNKSEAFIDEWVYDGVRLSGRVTNHDRQNDFKQSYQQTSFVIEFDMVEGYAETEHTYYRLGTPGDWNTIRQVTIAEQSA